MKQYDLIAIGTGSAMNILQALLEMKPDIKAAVIDKDPPGGICLTRGCIPTKILLYPAELLRMLDSAADLGLKIHLEKPDFPRIMERMRKMIHGDIEAIREGLSKADNIDYYEAPGAFTAPYQVTVDRKEITGDRFFLCTGSRVHIPKNIKNLETTGYLTSDTVLELTELPESIAIIGGGYIAAEYAHFFSAMGAKVAIIGRNLRLLPQEEPEVGTFVRRALSERMVVLTGHEVVEVGEISAGKKKVVALDLSTGKQKKILVDAILIAAGRESNSDILHPEKAGIETDPAGWIEVDEYLQTSQPNIWAFGDANGKHLFKHVANYESRVVYYNAVLGEKVAVKYDAVPRAVFTHPETAAVGMGEVEAIETFGREDIYIGFERYGDTAKGMAMMTKGFVKVILHRETERILGAHIAGPHASMLIQEIVTLMYTSEKNIIPITEGMHIHPSLSEVVERACLSLMSVDQYHHQLEHEGLL